MISSRHRFIYLHVPKTGGSSIDVLLEPFSDDHRVHKFGEPNKEHFEVRGVSPKKHAGLKQYDELVDIGDYVVAISVRQPFERIVSLYFSPSEWKYRNWFGLKRVRKPVWDEGDFLTLAGNARPMVDYLRIGGEIAAPDHVIRFETLATDFTPFARAVGLPVSGTDVPHINKTAAQGDVISRVLASGNLRRAVEDRFAVDMEYFSY